MTYGRGSNLEPLAPSAVSKDASYEVATETIVKLRKEDKRWGRDLNPKLEQSGMRTICDGYVVCCEEPAICASVFYSGLVRSEKNQRLWQS
ncbi:unnamed protein product [Clavelina lepadiformis]|uniref:Uncharacterized protein n=1 Tax=Clavelina lepadiformis TaxID=159417 RepID=A0ABP0GAX3_CLALP